MKFNLKLLVPAAALLLASTASADITIRLTGSTAFRASTVTAIKNIMTLSGTNHGCAYTDGSSLTGANKQIFLGTVASIPGHVITVQCAWSGAVAGVKALNNNDSLTYLTLNTTAFPSSTGTVYALSANGTAANIDNVDDTGIADIAMTDNLQGSTKYTENTLAAAKVGIIPFAWVASKDAPAGLTNVTPQLAGALFKVGACSAALFTNDNADAYDQPGGTLVYAIGRDPLSGTRLVTFAESGIGIFSSVTQFFANSVTGSTVNTLALTAADAAVDAPLAGNNGFTSGGNVADLLRHTTTNVSDDVFSYTGKACFVSYVGESDAARAVNGTGSNVSANNNVGCRYLAYNGVNAFGGVVKSLTCDFTQGSSTVEVTTGDTTGLVVGQLLRSSKLQGDSIISSIVDSNTLTISKPVTATTGSGTLTTSNLLPTAIWNGSYTFWGYEYIMWRTSLAGDKLTFGNALKTQIHDVDYFTAGLSETSMRVNRTSDGGTVTQTY